MFFDKTIYAKFGESRKVEVEMNACLPRRGSDLRRNEFSSPDQNWKTIVIVPNKKYLLYWFDEIAKKKKDGGVAHLLLVFFWNEWRRAASLKYVL